MSKIYKNAEEMHRHGAMLPMIRVNVGRVEIPPKSFEVFDYYVIYDVDQANKLIKSFLDHYDTVDEKDASIQRFIDALEEVNIFSHSVQDSRIPYIMLIRSILNKCCLGYSQRSVINDLIENGCVFYPATFTIYGIVSNANAYPLDGSCLVDVYYPTKYSGQFSINKNGDDDGLVACDSEFMGGVDDEFYSWIIVSKPEVDIVEEGHAMHPFVQRIQTVLNPTV